MPASSRGVCVSGLGKLRSAGRFALANPLFERSEAVQFSTADADDRKLACGREAPERSRRDAQRDRGGTLVDQQGVIRRDRRKRCRDRVHGGTLHRVRGQRRAAAWSYIYPRRSVPPIRTKASVRRITQRVRTYPSVRIALLASGVAWAES